VQELIRVSVLQEVPGTVSDSFLDFPGKSGFPLRFGEKAHRVLIPVKTSPVLTKVAEDVETSVVLEGKQGWGEELDQAWDVSGAALRSGEPGTAAGKGHQQPMEGRREAPKGVAGNPVKLVFGGLEVLLEFGHQHRQRHPALQVSGDAVQRMRMDAGDIEAVRICGTLEPPGIRQVRQPMPQFQNLGAQRGARGGLDTLEKDIPAEITIVVVSLDPTGPGNALEGLALKPAFHGNPLNQFLLGLDFIALSRANQASQHRPGNPLEDLGRQVFLPLDLVPRRSSQGSADGKPYELENESRPGQRLAACPAILFHLEGNFSDDPLVPFLDGLPAPLEVRGKVPRE